MNNKIVIYKSRDKAFLIILVSLLLATAAWLSFRYTDRPVLGWSTAVLSILCLLFGIGTLFDRKPYIVLTPKGITELSNIWEEIEWDAILHVDDFYYRGQHFIRLLVNKNYKPESVRSGWFYRFDRFYEQEGVKAVFIRMGFFEVNSIKLARFIDKMVLADAGERIELLNKQPAGW